MSKLFDSRLADVIRKPVITEKATNALDLNQYTFEVDHRAAKPQIKAAIEALFSVKVIGVNTMNPPRRTRRVGKFSGKFPDSSCSPRRIHSINSYDFNTEQGFNSCLYLWFSRSMIYFESILVKI